jgi:hypothetical protein
MTCRHCKAAEVNPDHAFQTSGCRGCGIRELATGPLFHGSSLSGRLNDPYVKALAAVFGTDLVGGHAAVKAERKRLDGLRVLM